MDGGVDPSSPGSRLDADHPENGVLIPCLFTPRRDASNSIRCWRNANLAKPSSPASATKAGCACAAYDDGGFSGATLDRPALQRLLADIAAGRVDTAVVYKIDRLTRSLADFAKIVEILEPRPLRPVAVWVLRLIERWLKAGILESSGADACWAANAARSVRFDASSSRLSRSWR